MRIAALLEVVEPAAGISREEADRAIRATASFSLDEFVRRVAQREGTDRETAYEVALAWVLAHAGACAIPEAGTVKHVRQNRTAADLELADIDMLKLDETFPPPSVPQPLEVL